MTDFDAIPKQKFSLEQLTKHPEHAGVEEALDGISRSKTSPNFYSLKMILQALETLLMCQKEILRRLERMEEKK